MEKVVERFIKYTKFDTMSNSENAVCPSTTGQLDLGRYLVSELISLGIKDASMDQNGYIMATLPGNINRNVPTVGFIAHMDTSSDMKGAEVKAQLIKNYNGKSIVLQAPDIILSPREFPELLDYVGEDLLTTDGTTLLGADDKAGICAIVTAAEYLLAHPEIKHGPVRIGFTPDEEIGRGADLFDVAKFNAAFAYTVDGGALGELEYENFNAAGAKIKVHGRNVHPGTAKNKMKNSLHIAMEFDSMLPAAERPSHTDGYEGFYHLTKLAGDIEETDMAYIIRDHDKELFEFRKNLLTRIADYLNDKYGQGTLAVDINDQYYNMREKIEPVMHIVDLAQKAMEEVGVTPRITPVRGGTDGARLSYMGLPCPNIFTGGHNFHGRYEFLPVNSLKKATEVIIKIIELSSK
jgi:tripeptide aminopeptidase